MPGTRYTGICIVFLLFFSQLVVPAAGQLGFTPDIKKPKPFENRVLRSEKSDRKKFKLPAKLIQNNITHYNYFFNANNKLTEVLRRAKEQFKDDYSQLIPFYNYTLDATAADSIQLDSIGYKAQTAIVLHDLRNAWADNMYLLWGAAYYLQKDFDSAYAMFQFINWAFADKESDGYYRAIGSARDGNSPVSISTKEKRNLTQKIFNEPPSRNDAFIWQIRNHLAQDQFAAASSLIQALRNDPNFPKRLENDLEEVQALYWYKQNAWDSAAAHLELALDNAGNKQERARWEFLLAQLNERSNKFASAEEWYGRAIGHTTDPILDVYARLASVRSNQDSTDYIDRNIATLLKMARRDKYVDYRDIIYYMAAQMDIERGNTDGALELLLRSTRYAANNPTQRNKAFLQLAELSYDRGLYRQAYNFYDSVRTDDPTLKNLDQITARKTLLARLADNIEIIERQDSLQYIASLPEDERKDIVRRKVKQLRKAQGLKDESGSFTTGSPSAKDPPPSLFPEKDEKQKGEWYFYNSSSLQKGQTDFKTRWGNRPNTDNWRRSAGIVTTKGRPGQPAVNPGFDPTKTAASGPVGPLEITLEALTEKLPLTEEKMKVSNDSIRVAMSALGISYIQDFENCKAGTDTLESLVRKFPEHDNMEEVLFNLYYCYKKNGDMAKADAVKKLMADKFGKGRLTSIVKTGNDPETAKGATAATQTYEKIYNQFIEGSFQEAIAQKKIADSIYGRNYWTPQLLYIEAIYYIKQRDDSTAKNVLSNLVMQFAGTPMAEKATTMLDVLGRRAQIEEELRNMVIERPAEDTAATSEPVAVLESRRPLNRPVRNDSTLIKKPETQTAAPTVANKPGVEQVKQPAVDTVVTKPVKTDTVAKKPVVPPPVTMNNFVFKANDPHYVVIVLSKVDPIFVSEARNAFSRYNRDTYYNKQMQAELVEVDADNRLLLISPFANAAEATDYIDQTRPKTASEIIPWLTGGRYFYLIINNQNLEVLKNSKDINKYQEFLKQNIPGKF